MGRKIKFDGRLSAQKLWIALFIFTHVLCEYTSIMWIHIRMLGQTPFDFHLFCTYDNLNKNFTIFIYISRSRREYTIFTLLRPLHDRGWCLSSFTLVKTPLVDVRLGVFQRFNYWGTSYGNYYLRYKIGNCR